MAPPSRRAANRVLLLCSSIHDRTAWPIWKFLEMRQRRDRMMDIAILAFNTNGGSFEARVDGHEYSFKPYKQVQNYQQDLLEHFVHRWHDPGRTYFVYGGHGMGDYIDLEQGVTSLPVHQLASILGDRKFEGMVFDSCFMSNLDCAYHLRHHTRYIGACEGYMWEPDHIPSRHIFNHRTAALICRGECSAANSDLIENNRTSVSTPHAQRSSSPFRILEQMQRRYCRHSPFADFSILDTTYVEDLRKFVQRYVISRVYDRLTFYNDAQLKRLGEIGVNTLKRCESLYHWSSSSAESRDQSERISLPSTEASQSRISLPYCTTSPAEKRSINSSPCIHSNNNSFASSNDKPSRQASISPFLSQHYSSRDITSRSEREILMQSVQLEHSLYPSSMDDKQLVDLKSYLVDMAKEEALELHGGYRSPRYSNTSSSSLDRRDSGSRSHAGKNPWSLLGGIGMHPIIQPRTHNVHLHGTAPSSSASAWSSSSSSTWTPLSSSGRSSVSSSPILEGSARQGLQLLDRVVVKQQGPRAKPLYASRLGGLSVTIHEFSPHSDPLEIWMLPACKRKALKTKMNHFLKEGKLEEVILPPLAESGQLPGKVRSISTRKRKEKKNPKHLISQASITTCTRCSGSSDNNTNNSNNNNIHRGSNEEFLYTTVKKHHRGPTADEEKSPILLKVQQQSATCAVNEEKMTSEVVLPPSSTTAHHHSFLSLPSAHVKVVNLGSGATVSFSCL